MENNDNIVMSRIAFERMQAKDERNDKWRNAIIIILIAALLLTNGLWLWHESQYEFVSDEYSVEMEADDGSNANYIGNNGDINNGSTDKGKQNNSEKDKS